MRTEKDTIFFLPKKKKIRHHEEINDFPCCTSLVTSSTQSALKFIKFSVVSDFKISVKSCDLRKNLNLFLKTIFC